MALVQLFTIAANRNTTNPVSTRIQKFARPLGAATVLIGLGLCLLGACFFGFPFNLSACPSSRPLGLAGVILTLDGTTILIYPSLLFVKTTLTHYVLTFRTFFLTYRSLSLFYYPILSHYRQIPYGPIRSPCHFPLVGVSHWCRIWSSSCISKMIMEEHVRSSHPAEGYTVARSQQKGPIYSNPSSASHCFFFTVGIVHPSTG